MHFFVFFKFIVSQWHLQWWTLQNRTQYNWPAHKRRSKLVCSPRSSLWTLKRTTSLQQLNYILCPLLGISLSSLSFISHTKIHTYTHTHIHAMYQTHAHTCSHTAYKQHAHTHTQADTHRDTQCSLLSFSARWPPFLAFKANWISRVIGCCKAH